MWGCVGGHFQWFLPPTFLRISGSQVQNSSNFTNINEFHEFWCLFDFRNTMCKFGPKWDKTQAGRPSTMPFHLVTPLGWSWARYQAKIKSCTQVQSFKIERHAPRLFGSIISDEPKAEPTWDASQDRGSTWHSNRGMRRARARPTGLGEASRPRKPVENTEQLTTDSREESKPSREGRRQMVQSPGRPAVDGA